LSFRNSFTACSGSGSSRSRHSNSIHADHPVSAIVPHVIQQRGAHELPRRHVNRIRSSGNPCSAHFRACKHAVRSAIFRWERSGRSPQRAARSDRAGPDRVGCCTAKDIDSVHARPRWTLAGNAASARSFQRATQRGRARAARRNEGSFARIELVGVLALLLRAVHCDIRVLQQGLQVVASTGQVLTPMLAVIEIPCRTPSSAPHFDEIFSAT